MLFKLYNCEQQIPIQQEYSQILYTPPAPVKDTSIYEEQLINIKRKRKEQSLQPKPAFCLFPHQQQLSQQSVRMPLLELHKIDNHASQQKLDFSGKNIKPIMQYALKIPIELIYQNQQQNDPEEKHSRQVINSAFERLLEENQSQEEDMKLEIQSKFLFARSKNNQEIHLLEPEDRKFEEEKNTHEKLLEEENYYLREELIHFTKGLQSQRKTVEQMKRKNRTLRKQNLRLSEQIEQLNATKKNLEQNLSLKDEQAKQHSIAVGQLVAKINQLQQQKSSLVNNLQILQRQLISYSQKLYVYEMRKQREIELVQQQREKLKQSYVQYLCQKQKQIVQLKEYIASLKTKITQIQKDQFVSVSHQPFVEQINTDMPAKDSFCISLIEAQTLKNIIEERQYAHNEQISQLKQTHSHIEQSLKNELFKMKTKILQIESNKCKAKPTIENEEDQDKQFWSDQKQVEYSNNEIQFRDELKTLAYNKHIQNLQRHIAQQRQIKMDLMRKFNELSQSCMIAKNEKDQEMEELLESCIKEIERQRKINRLLKKENSRLRNQLQNSK